MLQRNDAYLVGYYGMRNSGDDALMLASAWGIKHILGSNTTKISLAGSVQHPLIGAQAANLKPTQRFSGENRLAHYRSAFTSKRVVFGGGSVLHSETDINLKRHLMGLTRSKANLALGVSVGPFTTSGAEKACTKFLNECSFVGVRDSESLDIAASIAPHANVQKTFDLAPLLLCSEHYQPLKSVRLGIALALCPVAIDAMGNIDKEAETRRVIQLAQLITRLHLTTGEPITLLEFNGHAFLGDWQINHPIMHKLKSTVPLYIKPYNPDPIAVLSDLGQYKCVISMRLHGAIMAYLADTPVISLNYHRKCRGWCEQIQMAKNYQFELNELDFAQVAWQVEKGLSDGFIEPKLPKKSALTQALSNWRVNDELTPI
jgi:polysaccharide pyruvyl transferase WcaK-like protein